MKTNRTYSIDVDVAKDLQQKQNQSQFVEDAIKAKLYPSGVSRHISDYKTFELLEYLIRLFDEDSLEYKQCQDMWHVEYRKHSISLNPDAKP
jgi:glycerol-3-phosphate responsive antiterminator